MMPKWFFKKLEYTVINGDLIKKIKPTFLGECIENEI